MKPARIKRFIRNAADLGISDLVDLIRTQTKKNSKERLELMHYLHNYLDRASDPVKDGIKNTLRRNRRKET